MAAGMKKFFKEELVNLKAKTLLNQFENLKQEPNWQKKGNELIDLMVLETVKPPLDNVRPEVIQRVLSEAVMSDKDFIGWSPKWVRLTLDKWWAIYGGKILEAKQQQERQEPEKPYTGPPIDVDVLIKEFLKTLQSGNIKKVPELTEREKKEEGKERPKAHVYHSTDPSYLREVDERVRKGREIHFRQNYPTATEDQVKQYLNSFEK